MAKFYELDRNFVGQNNEAQLGVYWLDMLNRQARYWGSADMQYFINCVSDSSGRIRYALAVRKLSATEYLSDYTNMGEIAKRANAIHKVIEFMVSD